MLPKGSQPKPEDTVTPEEEIKDPHILEFLGSKDEYSESELDASANRRNRESVIKTAGAEKM